MAITFIGSVIDHGNDALSKTPDFSGLSWAPGDIAIASGWRRVTNGLWSAPAGWYLLGGRGDTGAVRAGIIYYKILEVGEDETPTFTLLGSTTSTHSSVVVSIWRGVSQTNPIDTFSDPQEFVTNDGTPTPDPITTITSQTRAILWHASLIGTTFSGGAPSGYSLDANYGGATYDDRQQFLASKSIASPSTETPGDWTHSAVPGNNESGVKQSLALREPQTGDFPRAYGVGDTFSTASNHSVLYPAEVCAGDLLIVFIYAAGVSDLSTPVITGPTGFTRLDTNLPITFRDAWVGWKVAEAGDGGSAVQVTTSVNSNLVAQMFRFRGWDDAEVPEFVDSIPSALPPPLSITPSWGAADNLYLGLCASTLLHSPPAPLNFRRRAAHAPPTGPAVGTLVARAESLASSLTLNRWHWLQPPSEGNNSGEFVGIVAIKGDVVPATCDDESTSFAGWGIPVR